MLVGRIGWDAGASGAGRPLISGSPVNWMLLFLGILFFATLLRWLAAMGRSFRGGGARSVGYSSPNDQIDAATLEQWVRNAGEDDTPAAGAEDARLGAPVASDESRLRPEDSGARPSDEAQSTSSTVAGG
jgi:hypothetical protein